jgi:hypothetical protein
MHANLIAPQTSDESMGRLTGAILAYKIGYHQWGFIPGRDGRENIINVQMIIDLINSKNEEGAVVFLDQEKAQNMVSFTTINTIFKSLELPERFHSLLNIVYRKHHIRARVQWHHSPNNFAVNSGTKQGCPLLSLINVVVADLYNMAVISHKHYMGHPTLARHFVKISAYADNTAVHLRTLTDVKFYKLLLRQYSLATRGITNFNKLEEVLCGSWRRDPPDLGIKVVKATKYLGVITEDVKQGNGYKSHP